MDKPKLNQPDVGLDVITYNDKIYFAIDSLNPTIEEVKKEWEDDGWKWLDIYTEIYISKDNKQICIDKTYKTISYDCEGLRSEHYFLSLTLQEHLRLTKTFRALGWEV